MTPARERFARELAQGCTQAEAYARAYPRARAWSPCSLRVAASRLASDVGVSLAVAELQAEARAEARITLESHLEDLRLLREQAIAQGNIAAAIAAEVSRGRAAGLYRPQASVTVSAALDWKALIGEDAPRARARVKAKK